MKETVDHNLEINQDPLKILMYSPACVPLTMLFLLLNKLSEIYLKSGDAARFGFEPLL